MNLKEYERDIKYYTAIIEEKIKKGTININEKGYYKFSQQVSYAWQSGKEVRAYGCGQTAEQCAKSFVKSLYKRREKVESKNRDKLLSEVATEWYNTVILHSSINEISKKDYKRYVEKEINPHIGKYAISALKERNYNEFMNRYEGQGEAKLKQLRMTLKRILKYAYKNDYIERNDFDIKIPKCQKTSKGKNLPENILNLLIKLYKNGDRQAEDFIILLMTGIRIREAKILKYTDIDLELGVIYIRESKTESGVRDIPIPDFIKKIFEKRMLEAKTKNYHSEYIFRQENHPEKVMSSDCFENYFNNCQRKMDILNGAEVYRSEIVKTTLSGVDRGKKSGLKYPYTPYQFRHTYTTLLDEIDVKESVIKEVVGHSQKNNITQSVYTHRDVNARKKALKPFFSIMEDFIKNPDKGLENIINDYDEK